MRCAPPAACGALPRARTTCAVRDLASGLRPSLPQPNSFASTN